jgi:hypothetical protein
MWSKAVLQNKQAEFLDRQLQFLDTKTADFLGVKAESINPALFKEAEKLYLRTVIESVVKRIKSSVESSLQIDQHEKAQFYKEFQRQLSGIEEEINNIFGLRLKELKDVRVRE